MKKVLVCYTFDVTNYRMRPSGVPDFKKSYEGIYIPTITLQRWLNWIGYIRLKSM